MSQRPAAAPGALVRVSVPARGELRSIVADVAAKVAEFLGQSTDATAFEPALDAVAARVAPGSGDAEITFEFRQAGDGLVIEARCDGKSSEVRCPLPA